MASGTEGGAPGAGPGRAGGAVGRPGDLPPPRAQGTVGAPPRSLLQRARAAVGSAPERSEAEPQRTTRRTPGGGCLLGVDIGTTGAKAVAFTPAGLPVGRGYGDYPLGTGADGRAELDSAAVLAAVRAACRAAAAEALAAGAGPVLALAAAAQGEAVTAVDEAFQPLRPGIVTFDRRGRAGCESLEGRGWSGRTEATGLPLSFIVTAAKLAYLREAEPDLYRRAAWFLCYEDLLTAHLTGRPRISDSLAQRTWLLDRHRRAWDEGALADLDLASRMAEVAPMGADLGVVSAAAATAFGLPPGCRVVAGAHDQTAALVGAGAILPGTAAHSTGTVDCLSLSLRDGEAAPFTARGYGLGLHPLPGLAVTLAFGFGGGSLLAWLQGVVGSPDVGALLEGVPTAPGDEFAVPFWAGSGTPDLDAADRGAFFGLTLNTGRGALVAAVLRGMALESRRNLHILAELGVGVREARLVGGGTRNPDWNQIRADVTGCGYTEMRVRDAGCLGAAVLAAVGIGLYRDVATACDAMVRTDRRFTPLPEHHAAYTALFPGYLAAVAGTRAARAAGQAPPAAGTRTD